VNLFLQRQRSGRINMADRSRSNWPRIIGIFSGALLFVSGSLALAAEPAAGTPPVAEICKGCHADKFESYLASVHGQKGNRRGPANAGECLVCHGNNALEHAKLGGGRGVGGIVNPGSKSLAPEAKNAICLTCHKSDSKRSHWEGSTHQARGVACSNCHTLHAPRDKVLAKITQYEVCFTCHKDKRVEINRPSRHAILEGKVACSDCHNPHGSVGPKLMKRDSVVQTCYQCHMEKRGPFVHNHEPVTEDCSICHNPHGTIAESMLKVRPPFLCHQCHTPHGGQVLQLAGQQAASSLASGKNGVNYTQGRGCVNCHTQIHGSNNPASGFPLGNPTPQFFLR
jgi:DmsE family decaheme c-type cytochrome